VSRVAKPSTDDLSLTRWPSIFARVHPAFAAEPKLEFVQRKRIRKASPVLSLGELAKGAATE
jgi:hypothetical protein